MTIEGNERVRAEGIIDEDYVSESVKLVNPEIWLRNRRLILIRQVHRSLFFPP